MHSFVYYRLYIHRFQKKPSISRENHPAGNPEEYYRRSIAIPLLDCIICELDSRFSSLAKTASKLLFLAPSAISNATDEDLRDIIAFYESDLTDASLVEQEIRLWRQKWSRVTNDERSDFLGDALLECDEDRFPNLFKLLKIACTLPITSCTCERSFSTLRRLRTWIRSSMGCSRMSSLALMNIHYGHPVCYDKAVDIFLRLHPRKIELSNLIVE